MASVAEPIAFRDLANHSAAVSWSAVILLAFLGLQFIVLWWPLAHQGLVGPSLRFYLFCLPDLLPYLGGAMLLRVIALAIGRRRASSPEPGRSRLPVWLLDEAWILLGFAFLSMTYIWCKLLLPGYGGALWDARLAAADRWVSLGLNPSVFTLTVFEMGPRWAANALDLYYLTFIFTMLAGTAWFVTDRRRDRRVAFAVGAFVLWSVGLWIYIAMPALGPALAYDGLWQSVSRVFPRCAGLEAALLTNYQHVLLMLANPGRNYLLIPEYGVAAMPSLHVAAHAYLFFWANRIGSRLRAPLLCLTILTFIGSLATGWHYAIDSWAGLLLGWLCATAAWSLSRRFTAPPARPGGSLAAQEPGPLSGGTE